MAARSQVYVSLEGLLGLRHHAKGFSFLPRQPVHSLLTGRHASRLRGRGLDFAELRHYAEGDDTRTIDWLATARRASPQVRIYTEERDRSVLLLVDQRLSMFFGSRRATKSAVAAEAAALAAFRVTDLGDRVGAIVFSEHAVTEIQPRAREAGVRRLLPEIVRQNHLLTADSPLAANPGLFNLALERAARLATHDWLVTIISDSFGADARTVELVTRITAHNDVLVVFVHDPLEAELPAIGRAVVAEAGRQIEVDLSANALRRSFASDFAGRRARGERFSLHHAIPVLPLSTDRDVAEQLRELLGRRLERRRRAA